MRCQDLTVKQITKFLVNTANHILNANLTLLSELVIQELIFQTARYSIIEHDHHYLLTRNPCLYQAVIASVAQKNSLEFYANAEFVVCQTSLHKECSLDNKADANLASHGCNFSDKDFLELLYFLRSSRSPVDKNNSYAVIQSSAEVKNTNGALEFCRQMSFETRTIAHMQHSLFLTPLSACKGLVFFLSCCSRLVVEASLLGLEIYCNARVGILKEGWFLQHLDHDSRIRSLNHFQAQWQQQVGGFSLIWQCFTK